MARAIDIQTGSSDHWPDFELGRARKVNFHSAQHAAVDGSMQTTNVTVHIATGDVYGLIDAVKEGGGCGSNQDGVWRFVPWPCAAVTVEDADSSRIDDVRPIGDAEPPSNANNSANNV